MARKWRFHTGEFARMTGVNPRTLHYYDAQGIFSPDAVEDNGYRSYSLRQCYTFYLIRMFRTMGLELSEIKDYMENRSPDRLDRLLEEQSQWLFEELKKIKRQIRIVDNQRRMLALAKEVVCGQVEEMEWPAARLVLSRNTRLLAEKENWAGVERLTMEHAGVINKLQLGAGLSMGAMVAREDFLRSGRESVVSYLFTRTEESLRRVAKEYRHIRPAGRYLVTYFRGDYEDTEAAYALLRAYIDKKQYKAGAFSYEESILEEMTNADKENYITRVAVPVLTDDKTMDC